MKLHVACSVTENYAMPLCGMLSSFFKHHHDVPVNLHVFTGTISRKSEARLEQFIRKHGADYHQHTIPQDRFQDLQLHRKHFAKAVFYRFLIPDLVKDTDRILYLDVDLLIRRSLLPLFQTDVGDLPIAAVPDAWPSYDCKRLGIPEHLNYFNAGVMVMNLPVWRRDGIAASAIDFLLRHNGIEEKCRYADQDGLNAVLPGRWRILPEDWNFNIYHCSQDLKTMPENRRNILRSGPSIVHYADHRKPWLRNYGLPFQQEFLRNARANGFRYPHGLTLQTIWPWFLYRQHLRQLKTRYRQADIPWRA